MSPYGGYSGGAIDTLIGLPVDHRQLYRAMTRQMLRDAGSQTMTMPAEYMFHDVPDIDVESIDPVEVTLAEMDRFDVRVGLLSLGVNRDAAERALTEHPDRFVPSLTIDPNSGMAGIRDLVATHERWGLKAVAVFPHGNSPQIAIDAPQMYPIYSKCVELGLPLFMTVGIAGPRVPSMVQKVELLDRVMYDFPDLVVVMRHGAEPWVELAVKLMLKWPNLYYSTSAFAPKHYPEAIVHYANTRGSDRIMYAGYFPMGLTLERIFTELPAVGFADEVWPKFLHDNAARVLGLAASA